MRFTSFVFNVVLVGFSMCAKGQIDGNHGNFRIVDSYRAGTPERCEGKGGRFS